MRQEQEANPEWADTPRRTLAIAARAIDSLVQVEGLGDVLRTYLIAKQNKADFNLAYVGSDFSAVKHGMFDSVYMNGLFDYGYRLARDGTVWHKAQLGDGEATR